MLNQDNQIPSTSPKKLAFTGIPFSNPLTVRFPGITSETQKVVLELLEKNHKEYDIYFDAKGYHNHFVHHVLSAYSLGASVELLREIFNDNYATYQRPMPPSKVKITRENWTEHLGKMDLWTDYLEFFDTVVKEDGMEKAFNEYGFHPKLFPHFTAGVLHSAIHIGYGVEFQIPLVLSEGLAQAAVHPNEFEKVLDEDFFKPEGTEKRSIMDIVKSADSDNRFDFIVRTMDPKRKLLLAERADAVKELAKSWVVVPTEQGITEATRELYEACIILYGSTAIRPDKESTQLDFFLVHGVNAMLLTYAMLPYVTPEKQRMLLKAHFTGVLTEYIAQGRPELHIDYLNSYTPKNKIDSPNPWLEIATSALIEDDCHVIKAVRSLMKAEEEWPSAGKNNLYVKLAQLTCESYKATGWGRDIGFEEQWKEGQARRIRMGKNVMIQ